ncbi:MAG: hypothetical protein PHV34_04400 [Verrucomicrobiae bacterium]|nr:hypothetical protein [Verrucomicrobiae bacterium]
MGAWIGRNRKARATYGFDEISLVPGDVTINPSRFRLRPGASAKQSGGTPLPLIV